MERKLVSLQKTAQFLGAPPTTLREWEREGRLVPDERTRGGDRPYDLVRLSSHNPDRVANITVRPSPLRGCPKRIMSN